MIVVAILGVLAVIAIPSFSKTVRRSRTSEALFNMRRLFDSSIVYYGADHTTNVGAVVGPQFPDSQDLTPAAVPRGHKEDANPADWAQPTWQALNFSVSDPHYYSYQYYAPSGTSGFYGVACGDLDGDGFLSTFYRGGTVIDGGEVRGFAGIARINELE